MSVSVAGRRNIIADCDAAGDDTLAVLALAGDIVAITVADTGLAHAMQGAKNMASLMHSISRSVEVAYSTHPTMLGNKSFPEPWRERVDKVTVMPFSETGLQAPRDNAVELIISHLQKTIEKITLLCTGPLTNIAHVLRKEPALKNKIADIYIMGGAIDVPGNAQIGGSDVAEWNFFADPQAASIVLGSGAPIKLMPLDCTNKLPVTQEFVTRLRASGKTETAKRALQILESDHVQRLIQKNDYYFWDPAAAMSVREPDLLQFKKERVEVICTSGPNFGRVVRSETGSEISYAYDVDRKRFETLLIEA